MQRDGALGGEIRERTQVIALMRFYRARWRPLEPEGGVRLGRPSRRGRAPKERLRKRACARAGTSGVLRDTPEDTPTIHH